VAYTAFSNGEIIQFYRVVYSRADVDDACPVSLQVSDVLQLVPACVWPPNEWPTGSQAQTLAQLPTPGFAALCRVLSAPAELLGEFDGLLTHVTIPMPTADGAPQAVEFALGNRVALGGYCDVYAASVLAAGGDGSSLGGATVAVKIPRYCSRIVRANQRREAFYLRRLNETPCDAIPCLLSTAPQSAADDTSEWNPAISNANFPRGLVMRPLGVPLECVLLSMLDMDPADFDFDRLAFARHVTRGVLRALTHAHARRLVHTDVRPSNIVLCKGMRADWSDALVVLVDWALVVAEGTIPSRSGGCEIFLHADLLSTAPAMPASPTLDLFATACTFAAVAWGEVCGGRVLPPWLLQQQNSISEASARRQAWLGQPRGALFRAVASNEPGWDTLPDPSKT
jgi:hypothetical protein